MLFELYTDFIENLTQTARLNFQSSDSGHSLGHTAFQWLLIQSGFNWCSNWSFLELRRNQEWPWGVLPKYVKLWSCSEIHGKRWLFILWCQLFHWYNFCRWCWSEITHLLPQPLPPLEKGQTRKLLCSTTSFNAKKCCSKQII